MHEQLIQIRGRGALSNPAGRFERLAVEPDLEGQDADGPGPRTQFLSDSSRTIIARNQSPDVGFDFSVNPYRGCEHGCAYCMAGDTPILMADGTTKRLEDVSVGDTIYGTVRQGWYRRYVKTQVLAHWRTVKPAYRLRLEDGTALVTSADHRFLTERGWKYVTGAEQGRERRPHLTTCDQLMGTGGFVPTPPESRDYKRGFLCGLLRGDALLATFHYERAGRADDDQHQFRLVLADEEALSRARQYLLGFGVMTSRFQFSRAGPRRKPLHGIRTQGKKQVEAVRGIVEWPHTPTEEWSSGFLAGIFDAEGSYSTGILRIVNTDPRIIEQLANGLRQLGFAFQIETRRKATGKTLRVVRLLGGLREHLRFFHSANPSILRKRCLAGQAVKSTTDLRIVSIEPLAVQLPLYDITTGTGDFIANGIVAHNCYARPTHEYLGFSAGLDFETRILVKRDAPELLRRELGSARWRPAPLAMSGVTDPYQPVERRLRLTRGCLEVLAEFRNPVSIITKNHLVTRDADLLSGLAAHGAAVVGISITTLDPALQRVMEPRTSTPARRLAAIQALARTGVPVAVMAAPMIPGLNDHELPAILEAAARAGARYAGFVPLRLPLGVAGLFEQWLQAHFPERAAKVLGRVRAMRGGRLNDARFGSRMRGHGAYAEQIRALFHAACRRAGLRAEWPALSVAAFRRPGGAPQLSLFGDAV
jgi:DNA repair photolyase